MSRSLRVVVVILAVAMAAVACGSSGAGLPSGQGTDAANAATSPALFDIQESDVESALATAKPLVDRLGSADAAIDALLAGGELGYSGAQLIAAVESGTLQADGTVNDQVPAGPRLNRIDLEPVEAQAFRGDKITKRPAQSAKLQLRFQVDGEKILLERLRESATKFGAFEYERQGIIGLEGVSLILVLLSAGATPDQVIEALILGSIFYESNGRCYSRAMPLKDNDPVERPCETDANSGSTEPAGIDDATADDEPAALAVDEAGALYEGDLESLGFTDSRIAVSILVDGTVAGELIATEQLDNYISSIDLCGLFDDEEDPDDCADSVESCPAKVLWSSNLEGLTFVGDPPDSGTVTGMISLTWDTTPDGCGEPSTETNSFQIEATVTPAAAQITVPFTIDLNRVEPAS